MQVSVGTASGIGPYLTADKVASTNQVITIAAIKLSWATLLLSGLVPCICSLQNVVVASQFAAEGVAALLLLVADRQGEDADAVAVCAAPHLC